MMATRRLHIQRLVLQGVAASDRQRLTAALQSELHRLLANANLSASVDLSGLDTSELQVRSGASPEAIGVAAARRLLGSLSATAACVPADGTGGLAVPKGGTRS